ncbi:phage integrase [Pseudomonas sp.]|uniref:phage integrase n=1 Tax=Pseudomonas sp. TaxID=306 RepID=UPI003CC64491
MAVIKQPNGLWKADVEPIKGKRFRKTFKTKGEAQRFEANCRAKLSQQPDWSPKPKDKRRLLDLIQLWYEMHGSSLTDGKRRHAILTAAAEQLNNPVALAVSGSSVSHLRAKWLQDGVSGKTANNRLAYLKAVYNQLYRLDEIDYPCPFQKVPALKLQERPLTYLTRDQIRELLDALDAHPTMPHPAMIARLCLATGCRWGEAQAITPDQVRGGQVTFHNTKGKRVRVIPISAALEKRLKAHWRQYGAFTNCLMTFCRVLESTSIKLPAGQASHVLRHSFASHFVIGGGSILVLQKILGHTSLAMTMRYAHLAPDHLQEALRLNPFDTFSTLSDAGKEKPLKS